MVLVTLVSLADSKQKDLYTFKVVNSRGKLVSLEKYRGSVSLGSSIFQSVSEFCTLTSLSARVCVCVTLCLFFTSSSEHFLCECNNIVVLMILACFRCTVTFPPIAYVARGLQRFYRVYERFHLNKVRTITDKHKS